MGSEKVHDAFDHGLNILFKGFPYILAFGLCLILPGLTSAVTVSTVGELVDAVNQANSGGDKQILLQDGTYTLDEALVIRASGVTVRSASGNRSKVIIRGNGMEEDDNVSHIFNIEADNFTARDMTLRNVYYHAVQMQPYAQAPTLINLHILDTGEQMIKAAYNDSQPNVHSDNGRVENCLFEYSAGIGPQWYIGGVDAHHAFNWVVRDNTFVNIRSPDDPDAGGNTAEHAIHFWNGSRNTLVEKNIIINCDRGIGFGLGDRGHVGGLIRNNMIHHNAAHDMGDVGIGLESVTDAQVYNNTIYQEHAYDNAIEYRFSTTTGLLIANNLTNRAIAQRDEASAEVSNNVTDAESAWFVNPATGDLHLAFPVPTVVNQGGYIDGLVDDMDGDSRPQGGGYDIGADEYDACPECSGGDVILNNAIFTTGTICECIAATSITIGTSVIVQTGATVTFAAPRVRINPGFHAENGSIVHIRQE